MLNHFQSWKLIEQSMSSKTEFGKTITEGQSMSIKTVVSEILNLYMTKTEFRETITSLTHLYFYVALNKYI